MEKRSLLNGLETLSIVFFVIFHQLVPSLHKKRIQKGVLEMGQFFYLISYCEKYWIENNQKYYLFNFYGAYRGHYLRQVRLELSESLEYKIQLQEEYFILAEEEFIRKSYLYGKIVKIKTIQDCYLS